MHKNHCVRGPSMLLFVRQSVSQLVSQSVWARNGTWQTSESLNSSAGRLVVVSSAIAFGVTLSYCVITAVLPVLWNFGRAFSRKLVVIVQGKLSYFKIAPLCCLWFVSFLSSITALPSLFFVISFGCWSEFPRQANISRLDLCLVRIALKLLRFRKPAFIGLKSGAGCTTQASLINQGCQNKPAAGSLNRLFRKLRRLLRMLEGLVQSLILEK